MTKISRREALLGVGAAAFAGLTTELGYSAETETKDSCWNFAPLDPRRVATLAYDNYGADGCLYGAFKGAVLAYAEAVEKNDAATAKAVRAFPFVALRGGRAGFGRLKEICGAVAGGVMFFSCFVEDFADVCKLAAELGEYAKTTALPEFIPDVDEHPNFLKVVANGITCREMGGAWMGAASDEQKKVVLERCKRHTASIMQKAAEILNAYFAEKAEA